MSRQDKATAFHEGGYGEDFTEIVAHVLATGVDGIDLFVNARIDVYFFGDASVSDTLRRGLPGGGSARRVRAGRGRPRDHR
ncbi:hypothetical protein [Actinosynnema sp. NPDC023587]|uniref:hypothetical protein n=1 Tax=Actinosynnema sp. NPDC023587 TaxID=3154695 RepID=UPI0033F2853E